LKKDKKYRLWTFQNVSAIEELKSKGILEVNWDSYSKTYSFVKPYQWMAKQMAVRGINCTNAPIWAWHSCGRYEKAPRLVDARCLLSDLDLTYGVQTIEFECSRELVLLTNYGYWNSVLDEIITHQDEFQINEETEKRLFETSKRRFRKYDTIQATLPYLKLDWVKEIRQINLKPNDFNIDWEEEV